MHNCPNCGSNHIQLVIEASGGSISYGGAIAGAAIGGILGGDAGSLIGGVLGARALAQPLEKMEINYCLNCGNKWNAEALFQLVNLVSGITSIELDLSIELHRHCLAEFVTIIIPKIHDFESAKNNRPSIIAEAKKLVSPQQQSINSLGGIILMIAIFCFFIEKFIAIMLFAVFICLLGIETKSSKEFKIKTEENAVKFACAKINQSKQELDEAVYKFVCKYRNPLMVG